MIKTLSQALRMDKERFKVPRSVQQAIPIQRIWPDGIFQQGTKFSKTFRFTDINYYIASKDNKTEMFLDYSELLNSLDSGISAKITINNRRINKEEFEKSILLPMKEDGLDHYREEYNEMLLSKITGTNNSIYQERYLTVSVHKKSIDEARTYFARIGTDIVTHLAKLSSTAEGLDAESRLQIFRDFFKGDVPQAFPFDLKQFAKKGTSFKDWMCPDSMEFERDHFRIGDRYGRVLYMQDYSGICICASGYHDAGIRGKGDRPDAVFGESIQYQISTQSWLHYRAGLFHRSGSQDIRRLHQSGRMQQPTGSGQAETCMAGI